MFNPDQRCPKCNHDQYLLHELRGASGGFSAYFDLDLAIFTAVSCRKCQFTEFYNIPLKNFKQKYNLPNEA